MLKVDSDSVILFDLFLRRTERDDITSSGRCVFTIKNHMTNADYFHVVLLHRDEIHEEEEGWNYCVAVTPDSVLLSNQPLSIVESLLLFEAMYRMRGNVLEGTKYVRNSDRPLSNIEIRLNQTKGCIYMCDIDQEVISEEITDES